MRFGAYIENTLRFADVVFREINMCFTYNTYIHTPLIYPFSQMLILIRFCLLYNTTP